MLSPVANVCQAHCQRALAHTRQAAEGRDRLRAIHTQSEFQLGKELCATNQPFAVRWWERRIAERRRGQQLDGARRHESERSLFARRGLLLILPQPQGFRGHLKKCAEPLQEIRAGESISAFPPTNGFGIAYPN